MRFNNQTRRDIVRISLGGTRVRVALSNAFATAALTIGAAHVATRAMDAAVVPGSGHAPTFSGQPTIGIPAGAAVVSDPVDLAVAALADLTVGT
jgi:hypothetical protein